MAFSRIHPTSQIGTHPQIVQNTVKDFNEVFRKHDIFINHILHNFFCRSFTPCSTKIRKSVFEESSCRNGISEKDMSSFLKLNASMTVHVCMYISSYKIKSQLFDIIFCFGRSDEENVRTMF